MKIKLNYVFKTLDGTALTNRITEKDKEGKDVIVQKDITLRQICENALLVERTDPRTGQMIKPINGVEKMQRYNLALQIHNAKSEIDLSVDDIKLLKDLIAEIGSPLIVGQAWNILDPREPKETIPKDK